MRELFQSIPSSVYVLMSDERKEDLLRKYDAEREGREYTSPFAQHPIYSNEAAIMEVTDDYLLLRLDESSSMQLKVLPKGWWGYIVSVVLTSEIEPRQSVILFYDRNWQRLSVEQYFTPPSLSAFFADPKLMTLNEVKQVFCEVATLAYSYQWDANEPQLTVRITTFDTPLYQKLYPEAMSWLTPDGVSYQWRRGKLRKR